ncbi:MAG: hypothetical protein R6X32_09725 [Chloroflexota bacterium]|jgi:hypothetical protein
MNDTVEREFMNLMLKHTITVSAVLLAVSAVGLLVAPKQMMQIVGIEATIHLTFLLRTGGVGVLCLVPGVWAARKDPSSLVSRAVLSGLVLYLFLSSAIDALGYWQTIVNDAALPSIAMRVTLASLIVVFLIRSECDTPQAAAPNHPGDGV